MKYGTSLSFGAMKNEPRFIRDFARRLEAGGLDYMSMAGHLLSAPPDSHPGRPAATYVGPYREPFVLYSHLAALTERLEFFTSIMILPLMPTPLVAKQAAELSLFSDNRFNLGVGISWNEDEYEAMGQDVHTRGRRFEEQLVLLRRLWSEPFVTFEGRFHKLNNIGLNQLPSQHIPLWMGSGTDEKLLRRVARHADGWIPQGDPTEPMQRLKQYLRDEGRDPAEFGLIARINGGTGAPDDWRADAHRLKEVGVTHLTIGAAPDSSPDQEIETALRVREVLAADSSL